jgi:hypothetical protein
MPKRRAADAAYREIKQKLKQKPKKQPQRKADVLAELEDLLKQATQERSHYYTASVLKKAIEEIAVLRWRLDVIKMAMEVT